MHHSDSLSQHTPESLAGCWHRIGALELRRLVLEGATLVLREGTTMSQSLAPAIVLVSEEASAESLQSSIPDQQALIICIGPDWGPAHELAIQLHSQGYQHVFTPETDWGGSIAINSSGAHDRA